MSRKRIRALCCLVVGCLALTIYQAWTRGHLSEGWISTFVIFVPIGLATYFLIRSGFKVSLKVMMVSVGLLTLLLAATFVPLRNEAKRRWASNHLSQLGGVLSADRRFFDITTGKMPTGGTDHVPLAIPAWSKPFARQLAYVPRDAAVRFVQLSDDRNVVQALPYIKHFRQLEHIQLVDISEATLREFVRARRSVRSLSIGGGQLPIGGCSCLVELDQVERLQLYNVAMPAGVFSQLDSLQEIALLRHRDGRSKTLSRSHIEELSRLPNLQQLYISGYSLTDDDLAPLSNAVRLKTLVLKRTLISDSGLLRLQTALPDSTIGISQD